MKKLIQFYYGWVIGRLFRNVVLKSGGTVEVEGNKLIATIGGIGA